jgi:hypothetical protein
MKTLIAIVLAVCSLSALGYQRMDFDWMRVPGAMGVVLDRRNITTTGSMRSYWIHSQSVPQKYGAGWFTYLRQTDCENLESKILMANGYTGPSEVSLIPNAIQPVPLLLPFRSEFLEPSIAVVDNDKEIASLACSL